MTRNTLDPETRLLYGDSLQAPPGYRFDAGVATTFSLDFETALAVPVSLALFAADNREEILQHPIAENGGGIVGHGSGGASPLRAA